MRRHKRRQLHVQWSPGTIAKRHKAALCACKSTVSWQAEHQKSKFLNYHIYKYYIIYITIGLHDCTFQWPTTASGSRPLLLPRKNRRPRVPIIPEEVAISSFAKLIGSLSLKTAEFNKMILQFFSTNNTGNYIKRCAKMMAGTDVISRSQPQEAFTENLDNLLESEDDDALPPVSQPAETAAPTR